MSKPIKPSTAAILRSVQKDEYYTNSYRNDVNQLLQRTLGPRTWIRWRAELDSLIMFSYYAATTLNGLQTLGEEYVRIVQIEGDRLRVPSLFRRVLMIVLQTMAPMIIDKVLRKLDSILSDHERVLWPPILNQATTREKVIKALPVIKETLNLVHRLHIALFYFNGSHYELSKRLTGVRYTAIRSWMVSSAPSVVYKILGTLTTSQLVLTILLKYWNSVHLADGQATDTIPKTLAGEEDKDESVQRHERCSLCLEKRRHPTASPCGHLFCWTCIHSWLQNKAECPICREKFDASRLVSLQNYDN